MLPRRFALAQAALLALAAVGCSSADEDLGTNEGATAENLVIGDMTLSNDVTVFPDHLEVPFHGHENLRTTLKSGKMVSGRPTKHAGNPHGFLRNVNGVRDSGDKYIIDTTDAALTQAIANGSLHSNGLDLSGVTQTESLRVLNTGGSGGTGSSSSGTGSGGSSGSGSSGSSDTGDTNDTGGGLGQTLVNDFSGSVVLHQTEAGELSATKFNLTESVKVAEGNISFTPTFEHDIKIANHSLQMLAMKLGGDIKLHALLDVKVDADVDLAWDTTKGLPTKTATQVLKVPRIGLPVQMVGALPVYESLDLGVTLGCDFTFKGPIETQVGLDFDLSAAVGAAYQSGTWTNTSKSPRIDLKPIFKMTAQGQITLQCYVQPTATLLFYSVAGPEVQFGPYVQVDTEFKRGQDFRYAVYPGFSGTVGGSFQLFDRDIASGEFNVFQCQSRTPWLSSSTLPSEDSDNASSPACSFFGGGG